MTSTRGFNEIKRKGWALTCPFCTKKFLYATFSNQQGETPFFYSDASNDVLLKKSDEEETKKLFQNGRPSIDELETLWKRILEEAPPSPSGGRFTFWANVRCPLCNTEFPYNQGVHDVGLRINEPKIIVVDGAVVVDDDGSYRVKVTE